MPIPATTCASGWIEFRTDFLRLRDEVGKVIVGQLEILDDTLMALIAGGHVLLEGVPGLGKTLTVRTLADALHLKFQRIQFTPDLMPADLIGTNIVMETPEGRQAIRVSARARSSATCCWPTRSTGPRPKRSRPCWKRCRSIRSRSPDRRTRLSEPFFVLATQNPLEMEGTYPLPEAQLDRFFCKLLVKYPQDRRSWRRFSTARRRQQSPRAAAVLSGERILEMSRLARQIPIASEVRRYGIALVMATHPEHELAAEIARSNTSATAPARAARRR